jgi:hypothetical protein
MKKIKRFIGRFYKLIRRFYKRYILGDWWTVRHCMFPFFNGYCTYNQYKKTILDTGLRYERAKKICEELNNDM